MSGWIEPRGKDRWRVTVVVGHDANGERVLDRVNVRGLKRDANAKMVAMLADINKGTHVKTNRVTVGEWVHERLDAWVAAKAIAGSTEDGYRRAVEDYIIPHLGARPVQSLKPLHIERWHEALCERGLAAQTIRGAHSVLNKALREATKFEVTPRNVCSSPTGGQAAPKGERKEMEILTEPDMAATLAALRARQERRSERGRPYMLGRSQFIAKVVLALFTGLRRGEILALRWGDVDLDAGFIQVRQAMEETKKYGLRVKTTKTGAGRRDITLPAVVREVLVEHRREQMEVRMRLALGKITDVAPMFPALDGGWQSPRALSGDWREFTIAAQVRRVGFHALRHTHASMLISSKVDIVEISKRLGHADPSITLKVYAHLFTKDDSQSAAAIDAALARLGTA